MPLFSLQYLRGFAALMVVVVHMQLQLERFGYHGYWPSWTVIGVDIFFVLSGFLMWHTTEGRNQRPMEFWRRRIARIVPLYWLITTVVVMVLVVAPQLMQSVRLDWANVLASYFFVFWPTAAGSMVPVLVVGWTLNYEMLFYLVYGASLALPARLRFGATAVVIGLLVLLDYPRFGREGLQEMRGAALMLEFVFGMALAAGWRRVPAAWAQMPWLGWALLLGGILALPLGYQFWPHVPWAIGGGLSAVAIVGGALWLERAGALPHWPALRRLGDWSFSLYLSHPIVLSAFAQAWTRAGLNRLPAAMPLFCVCAVAVCIVVGWLVYRTFELPMTRHFNAFTGARLGRTASTTVS